ncbi:MAG: sigma-70 family RNA polymerase sigma factor [Planctomycetota bacterium]|jgi:RNA polymerase sigma-70 factor (ECF subfamily)
MALAGGCEGTIGVQIRELIADARAGDLDSLNALMRHYRGYLRILAGNSLDGVLRVKADPSDVAQEVLYAASRDFAGFRGDSERELIGWLRKILAHSIANLVRRYRRTGARQIDREQSIEADLDRSSMALGSMLAGRETAPSQAASERERSVVLANALSRLPDDYRQVIILRDLEQRSWAECGHRMGRSPDAVRMLWSRALASLGPLLREILD